MKLRYSKKPKGVRFTEKYRRAPTWWRSYALTLYNSYLRNNEDWRNRYIYDVGHIRKVSLEDVIIPAD